MAKDYINQWYKEGQYWEPKWMENNAVARSQEREEAQPEKPAAGIAPAGEIVISGLTSEELSQIALIPEDAKSETDTTILTKNGEYEGDGLYFKNFTEQQYWYKVSNGGKVTVTMNETRTQFIMKKEENSFWRFAAETIGREYYIGWKPKSDPHTQTVNPFE